MASDPLTLPRRDAYGRLLEPPSWLRPGWQRINSAGLGTGGALRKLCARGNCRGIALKVSSFCRHHDVGWKRKRTAELRTGKGRPATMPELIRLHRANMRRLWSKSPWQPLLTIWLAPRLEAAFVEDCRRAGLDPAGTAPLILNTLRWVWKRSVLDRDDDAGWQRALAAAKKHQARIGPMPEGYVYSPPSAEPPGDPKIKAVYRRATAFELAPQTSPVDRDRTSKSKERRRRSRERQPPATFDPAAFIAEHWSSMFVHVFKSLHLDDSIEIDGPIGHQLALAWHAVIDEQSRLGDQSYGPARKRWQALLRQLSPP